MALTINEGAHIKSGSVTLRQYNEGNVSDNKIGLGYWYNSGNYRGLRSLYHFRVDTRCSELTIRLAYTEAESGYRDKPFFAAVLEAEGWTGTAEDTQYFSDQKTAAFTVERTLEPDTDYYLLLWSTESGAPGGVGTRYNSNSYGDLTAELSAKPAGAVHIDGGAGWSEYGVWIDNGRTFEQYVPYVDTGTGWVQCG